MLLWPNCHGYSEGSCQQDLLNPIHHLRIFAPVVVHFLELSRSAYEQPPLSTAFPINSLPDELLAEVFKFCPRSPFGVPSNVFPPIAISSTCRRWRRIALSTPSLWTVIVLRTDMSPDPVDYFAQCLSRSGALPFHLAVSASLEQNRRQRDIDRMQLALMFLRDHFYRCRVFTMSVAPPYTVQQFIHPVLSPLPEEMCVPSMLGAAPSSPLPTMSKPPEAINAPRLRVLSIASFPSTDSFETGLIHAPALHTLQLHHFVPSLTPTSLSSVQTLYFSGTASLLTRIPFPPFLETFTHLHSCTLHFQKDFTEEFFSIPGLQQGKPISLPLLRDLHISGWRWPEGPLSLLLALQAPELETLTMSGHIPGRLNAVFLDFDALLAPGACQWDPATLRVLHLNGVDLLRLPEPPAGQMQPPLPIQTAQQQHPAQLGFFLFLRRATNLRELEVSHCHADLFAAMTPAKEDIVRDSWPCGRLQTFVASQGDIPAMSFVKFVGFIERRVKPHQEKERKEEEERGGEFDSTARGRQEQEPNTQSSGTLAQKGPEEDDKTDGHNQESDFLTCVRINRGSEFQSHHVQQLVRLMQQNLGLSIFMDKKLVWDGGPQANLSARQVARGSDPG